MNKNGKKRKKARTASDPGPDKAVYSWLVKERQAGTPISGLVMWVEAQKFQNQLHVDNPGEFIDSKGWLNTNIFQQRYGISQVQIIGEVRSADSTAADAFTPIL